MQKYANLFSEIFRLYPGDGLWTVEVGDDQHQFLGGKTQLYFASEYAARDAVNFTRRVLELVDTFVECVDTQLERELGSEQATQIRRIVNDVSLSLRLPPSVEDEAEEKNLPF